MICQQPVQNASRAGDTHPAGVVVLLAGAPSPLEVVADERIAVTLDQVAGVCGRREGRAAPVGGTAGRADRRGAGPNLTGGPWPTLQTQTPSRSVGKGDPAQSGRTWPNLSTSNLESQPPLPGRAMADSMNALLLLILLCCLEYSRSIP